MVITFYILIFSLVANRVLTVGDLARAKLYADLYLDKDKPYASIASERGFLTITGAYKGTPISIIGTGMGTPMIDFTIRETRAMVEGPMAFIRVGTCGSPSQNVSLGDIIVTSESFFIRRNPDQFHYPEAGQPYYLVSKPVYADVALSYLLYNQLNQEQIKTVHYGADVTADSFYSSQGRIIHDFDDHNVDLISAVMPKETLSIQMETFHLFDLARSSLSNRSVIAAGNCLVLAQRYTDKFIDDQLKQERERLLGKSALEALIHVQL